MLHKLHTDIAPPARFTWPFCYEPHPLCVLAAGHLQGYIESVENWKAEAMQGKMFGVLVARDEGGTLGYLAAFSGQLCGSNNLPGFVPPVYDLLQPDGYFKTHEAEITAINGQVERLENSEHLKACRQRLAAIKAEAERDIAEYKALMAAAKEKRDEARAAGKSCDDDALTRESQHMKAELRRKKQAYSSLTAEAEQRLAEYENRIAQLKQRRRQMSDNLQRWLFDQFKMLNALGEGKNLNDIFAEYHAATGIGSITPPSGAGECCAPKLLQYAYISNYEPLCMAEFWYGESPKSEVRRHLHYYPACRGKCEPILSHMLRGLIVDPNPLASYSNQTSELRIVYEDNFIAVVDKPSGMLSVPGKGMQPSVASITGLLPVNRLDMDTSGLLMLAKTEFSQRVFRGLFERRKITKRYIALLEGAVTANEGEISLPLAPDYSDRPRQKVDYDGGKPAVTRYEVIGTCGGKTLVALYPQTGRTHQLRVHCAHRDGLNSPIVGDRLYGTQARRLCLHAEMLQFYHPILKKQITIHNDNNEKSNSQEESWSAFFDRP